MDTIISTNVLFYVLSIFIVCLTLGFAILIVHIIKILRGIISFLDVIKNESEKIAQDIENIKTKLANEGAMFTSFIVNILSFFKNKQKKSKK